MGSGRDKRKKKKKRDQRADLQVRLHQAQQPHDPSMGTRVLVLDEQADVPKHVLQQLTDEMASGQYYRTSPPVFIGQVVADPGRLFPIPIDDKEPS